jgi:hypothetical protein
VSIDVLKEPSLSTIILDSWLSILRALSCIDLPKETVDAFDALMERAEKEGKNVFLLAYGEDIKVTPSLAAMLLQALIYHLMQAGDAGAADSIGMLRLLPNAALSTGTFEQRLIDAVVVASTGLLGISRSDASEEKATVRARDGFRRLAMLLSERGKHPEANACILSAVNVSGKLPPTAILPIAKTAVDMGLNLRDPDVVGVSMMRYAHLLIWVAEGDLSRQSEAFDAVEILIRNLPTSGEPRTQILELVHQWIRAKPYLRILSPLVWMYAGNDDLYRAPDTDTFDVNLLLRSMSQVWTGESADWVSMLSKVGSWWMEVENRRLELQKGCTPSSIATATWDSWSLVHPNLLHAVPHSTSLMRERNLDDYLLTLSHEITHVFSMTGPVGIATTAMRWALFDLDLELWSLSFKQESFAMDEIIKHMLESAATSSLAWWRTPQDDLTVPRLSRVEQALVLARKIQILEDSWAPWFEGLAIFGESADPTLDEFSYSNVASVITQLFETDAANAAAEQGRPLEEILRQKQREAEALYSSAVQRSERYRLRTHIDKYSSRYLAGYLAVRAVVSAWRRKLGQKLTSAEAFRVLLHATRFTDLREVIPDIALAIPDFEEALNQKHRKWLWSLAQISLADLIEMTSTFDDYKEKPLTYWRGGRLQLANSQDARTTTKSIAGMTAQALKPSFVHPEKRVGKVATETRLGELMVVAGNLRPLEPNVFVEERIPWVLAGNSILPIGRVECPFWILEKHGMLACLLRTTEQNQKLKPSYDLLAFSVESEKLSQLKREMEKHPSTRIEVSRVADLANLDSEMGRGLGRNLLVFRYGDWVFAQPRGMLFGSHNVSDDLLSAVKLRVAPNPLMLAQQELAANLRGFAERAFQWLDRTQGGSSSNPFEVDIAPWLEYIKDLAKQVVGRKIGQAAISTCIDCLTFATGDAEVAEHLQKEGLKPLRERDPALVSQLIDLLLLSGQQPVIDDGAESLVAAAQESLGVRFEKTSGGWDLAPPTVSQEESSNGNLDCGESASI